jgi:hypothetical protein
MSDHKEAPSIPLDELIEFHNERVVETNSRQKKLDLVKRVGKPSQTDIDFAEGIIRGKTEDIAALRAFIEIKAADFSGAMSLAEVGIFIDPSTPEEQ